MKAADDPAPEVKPFLEHIEDLRRTIIRCAISLGLGMAVAFPLLPRILGQLKKPLIQIVDDPDNFLMSMDPAGAFTASLQMAFWCGLLISSPFLILFIGQFVLPALTQREQRLVLRASGFAVALFAVGVWLAHRFTLPFALYALFGMNQWLGIKAAWTLTSYVTFSVQLLAAFGLAFEMPMILLILGKLGILHSAQLRSKRRHAIVAILVVAAALTPPDVFSLLIMSVPLILLYELCVWMIWGWERKKISAPGQLQTLPRNDP
jgi:sec-independent protein translocase protein TatC